MSLITHSLKVTRAHTKKRSTENSEMFYIMGSPKSNTMNDSNQQ